MEFANVGYRQPSVVWYFRSRVHGWFQTLDPTTVHAFMDSRGARFVILPTRTAQDLYPTIPPNWKSFTAQGLLPPRGKRLDLTLILKP
jgi:hypothetical protein